MRRAFHDQDPMGIIPQDGSGTAWQMRSSRPIAKGKIRVPLSQQAKLNYVEMGIRQLLPPHLQHQSWESQLPGQSPWFDLGFAELNYILLHQYYIINPVFVVLHYDSYLTLALLWMKRSQIASSFEVWM